MSFKDMLNDDIHRVFLNDREFADRRIVKYGGLTYGGKDCKGIPVLLVDVKELDRPIQNAEGIFGVHAVLYVALSDMDGKVPEKGQRISVDDGEALGVKFFRNFVIETSSCTNGMIRLELEAYDE